MAIKAFCEGCNKTYNVRDDMAGKRGQCPAGHMFTIPTANMPGAQTAPRAQRTAADVTSPAPATLPSQRPATAGLSSVPSTTEIDACIRQVLSFVNLRGYDQPPSCDVLIRARNAGVPRIYDAIVQWQLGDDNNPVARARLCDVLGEIGTPQAAEALAKLVKQHPTVWEYTRDVRPAAEAALAMIKQHGTGPSGGMQFMEVPRPAVGGFCSDDECPCGSPGASIPRGGGFIYVSQEVVDFRRDCLSTAQGQAKMTALQERLGGTIRAPSGVFSPILMCELGAEKRGLDMAVAAADARRWWETGLVPLRPTPVIGGRRRDDVRKPQTYGEWVKACLAFGGLWVFICLMEVLLLFAPVKDKPVGALVLGLIASLAACGATFDLYRRARQAVNAGGDGKRQGWLAFGILTGGVFAMVLFVAVSIFHLVQEERQQLRALEGEWVVVRVESNGQPLADDGERPTLSIQNGAVSSDSKHSPKETQQLASLVRPGLSPKTVTVRLDARRTFYGIYELHGDELRVCGVASDLANEDDAKRLRPAEFNSNKGLLMVFQRGGK